MKRRRSSPRGGGAGHAGLMPSGPGSGPPVAGRVVVGVDEAVDMYDVFVMGPEPALRTPPHVDLGEAPAQRLRSTMRCSELARLSRLLLPADPPRMSRAALRSR